MDLTNFFHLTASIFSIMATVFLIVLTVLCLNLFVHLRKISQKLEELSETAKSTANETRESIKNITTWIEQFIKGIFTVETVKKMTMEIINIVRNRKEEKDEKGK